MLFPERACSRRPTPSSPVPGKTRWAQRKPFLRTLQGSPVRPSAAGDLRCPRPPLCYAESAGGHRPLVPLPGGVVARGGLGAVLFLPFSQAVIQSNRQTPDAPSLPGSTAGWRGRPFSFAGPVTWSPCSRLLGWQALCPCLDPPVCLHGTPGHRPPVSPPGRLYQPVVRAPRRLYQRPGDLRPAQGPHHRTGNLQGGLSAS